MTLRSLLLSSLFFVVTSCSALKSTPYSDSVHLAPAAPEREVHEDDVQSLEKILNADLKTADRDERSCGGDLVMTCGNRRCEKDETVENCPSDCVESLIRSYNQQTLCTEVQKVYAPQSTEEVQTHIVEAVNNNLRLKVVGQLHSATRAICSEGIVLSTEKMNEIYGLEMFEGEETVRLQGGVTLRDLTEWLHRENRSIGYSVMGFRGVSIAGAMSTGSHGSSPRHTAVISNIVSSVKLVDAYGQVHHFSEQTTDDNTWKAVKAGLGMLGVITEVRLKVRPQFNLDVRLSYHKEKEMFTPKGIMGMVEGCDYGQLNWFPGTGKYMRTCGKETTKKAEVGATNALLNPSFPDFIVNPVKKLMQRGACHKGVACSLERIRWWQMKWNPPFKKKNRFGKLKGSTRVVGPSHRMMSSDLTSHQSGLFQMDWEIVLPASKADAALEAVRDYAHQNRICLPLVGVFIRFALSEDQTLLAHTVPDGDFKDQEPVVFIEMPVYLPVGLSPEMKAAYDKVYEDFARMLIQDFGGRAHWGKNREWAFQLQQGLGTYGDRVQRFQEVVEKFDPRGLFSNKFSGDVGIVYPFRGL